MKIENKKAHNANGVDWLEVVIPPLDEETEAEYTIRVHLTFLLSNWDCIYGQGCPGQFGVQDSTLKDDVGCCGDSFYFDSKDEIAFVQKQMEGLTDEDWDQERRAYVEKHGFVHMINNSDDPAKFEAKGKVSDGGCVFQNRNGGSSGKPGCAFHFKAMRENKPDHTESMPAVCWQLPLRYGVVGDESVANSNTYELGPWDVSQWNTDGFQFEDRRYQCAWWCVDAPDAYVSDSMVFKTLEPNIRKMIGDRPYELVRAAIESRLASGNTYANMPGATLNDGRPLIPLLVGNRKPAREPSYFPAHLDKIKDNNHADPEASEHSVS